jgi:predicted transcriptional regulator
MEASTEPRKQRGEAAEDARMTILLPRDLRERLRELAARNDRTNTAEARRAIAEHLDRAEAA